VVYGAGARERRKSRQQGPYKDSTPLDDIIDKTSIQVQEARDEKTNEASP